VSFPVYIEHKLYAGLLLPPSGLGKLGIFLHPTLRWFLISAQVLTASKTVKIMTVIQTRDLAVKSTNKTTLS
jgi:hypothetical protein